MIAYSFCFECFVVFNSLNVISVNKRYLANNIKVSFRPQPDLKLSDLVVFCHERFNPGYMYHDVEDVRDETIFSPQRVGVCLCLWQDYRLTVSVLSPNLYIPHFKHSLLKRLYSFYMSVVNWVRYYVNSLAHILYIFPSVFISQLGLCLIMHKKICLS